MRGKLFVLLAFGAAFFVAGVVCAILAIGQVGNASDFGRATACAGAASFDADCLQTVTGSVTAVQEIGGKNPHYELDVEVGSRALDITFPADNPMLGYASDGDPAEVTVWRGVPVAVTTDGRSAVASSQPAYVVAEGFGHCMTCLGVSFFFLCGPLVRRRQRRTGTQALGPLGVASLIAALLSSAVLSVGGFALSRNPAEPATVLTAIAVALAIVLALGTWAGIASERRNRERPELAAPRRRSPLPPVPRLRTPSARQRLRPSLRARLGYRFRPSQWLPALWTQLKSWLTPTLVVLVLSGLFLTAHDAPNARSFRDAPACQGETNLSVCVGEFTATVNGVRTTSPNADSAAISYVTGDGAINAWGSFTGSAETLSGIAQAEEAAEQPVQVEVWRRTIVGAEIDGSWHWATGNPPGTKIPAAFLAADLTLLLLLVRWRAHRQTPAGTSVRARSTRRALLRDDVGQTAVSAAGYGLLLCGYWFGALPILAVLGWMGWASWRRTRAIAYR